MSTAPKDLGKALEAALNKVIAKVTSSNKVMLAIATTGARIIKKRTADGKDKEGKAFAAYSPRYAKYRAAINRPAKPNLIVRNSMMGSLMAEAGGGKGRIFFLDRPMAKRPVPKGKKRSKKADIAGALVVFTGDVASYHAHGEGNNPVRDFAGVADRPEDIKAMKAVAEAQIRALLRKEAP